MRRRGYGGANPDPHTNSYSHANANPHTDTDSPAYTSTARTLGDFGSDVTSIRVD